MILKVDISFQLTSVVEVVDAEGHAVGGGEVGELIVTPLYEYATPRLRFATGYSASPDLKPESLIGVRHLAWAGNAIQ